MCQAKHDIFSGKAKEELLFSPSLFKKGAKKKKKKMYKQNSKKIYFFAIADLCIISSQHDVSMILPRGDLEVVVPVWQKIPFAQWYS